MKKYKILHFKLPEREASWPLQLRGTMRHRTYYLEERNMYVEMLTAFSRLNS